MRILFACLPALAATLVNAQAGTPLPPLGSPATITPAVQADSIPRGHVVVVESRAIAAMMADYAAREQPLEGFRVQIFLGDRSKAENTRRAFLLKHPDIPAYLSYLAPNFRIRVGDLRDRVAAEKLRGELSSEFPGTYVVPDVIEMPKLGVPQGN